MLTGLGAATAGLPQTRPRQTSAGPGLQLLELGPSLLLLPGNRRRWRLDRAVCGVAGPGPGSPGFRHPQVIQYLRRQPDSIGAGQVGVVPKLIASIVRDRQRAFPPWPSGPSISDGQLDGLAGGALDQGASFLSCAMIVAAVRRGIAAVFSMPDRRLFSTRSRKLLKGARPVVMLAGCLVTTFWGRHLGRTCWAWPGLGRRPAAGIQAGQLEADERPGVAASSRCMPIDLVGAVRLRRPGGLAAEAYWAGFVVVLATATPQCSCTGGGHGPAPAC